MGFPTIIDGGKDGRAGRARVERVSVGVGEVSRVPGMPTPFRSVNKQSAEGLYRAESLDSTYCWSWTDQFPSGNYIPDLSIMTRGTKLMIIVELACVNYGFGRQKKGKDKRAFLLNDPLSLAGA